MSYISHISSHGCDWHDCVKWCVGFHTLTALPLQCQQVLGVSWRHYFVTSPLQHVSNRLCERLDRSPTAQECQLPDNSLVKYILSDSNWSKYLRNVCINYSKVTIYQPQPSSDHQCYRFGFDNMCRLYFTYYCYYMNIITDPLRI